MDIIGRIKRALRRRSTEPDSGPSKAAPPPPGEGPIAIGHQPGPPTEPPPDPGSDQPAR